MRTLFQSLMQGVANATIRRGVARESHAQRQLRATDVREAWQHRFREAIAFASRMRAESTAYRDRLKRDGLDSPIMAESWNDLPVLTKDDFRRDTDSWFGEPFKFPLSKASTLDEVRGWCFSRLASGCRDPGRQIGQTKSIVFIPLK